MSRSKRKTPIIGIAGSVGQHIFKKHESRAKRHRVRQYLTSENYDKLPHDKEYGNEWSSPRDGKTWFGYDKQWKKAMRK